MNLLITNKKDTEASELKKLSINRIDNETFNKIIIQNKSLDYNYIVIDKRTENENIFTKAVDFMFDNNIDENELEKSLNVLGYTSNYLSNITKKSVFFWLSTIIERLPGRIIIIGDNQTNESPDNYQKWIKRRIAFVTREEIQNPNFVIKNHDPNGSTNNLNYEENLVAVLQSLWYKKFFNLSNYDLTLEINLTQGNISSGKISLEYIKDNFFEIHTKLVNSLNEICGPNIIIYGKHLMDPFNSGKNLDIDNYTSDMKYYINAENENIFDNRKDQTPIFTAIEESLKLNDKEYKLPNFFSKAEHDTSRNKIKLSIACKNHGQGGYENRIFISRHENINKYQKKLKKSRNDNGVNKTDYYQQSLSGASPFFNILHTIFAQNSTPEKKIQFFFHLIENGLTRILIADERIARFTISNKNILDAYNAAGIQVIRGLDGLFPDKGKNDEVIRDYISEKNKLPTFKELIKEKNEYDMFIVHQGVLDKIKLSKNEIKEMIFHWKIKFFPYVIITSGRGVPENIPNNAKFLPFSALENNLLTPNINKFNLTYLAFKCLSRRENV